MFPESSSWETSRLEGKQNYLFPSGPYIKRVLYLPLAITEFLPADYK